MDLAPLEIIIRKMPCRILDHQRNPVPYRKRQTGGDADQLLSRRIIDEPRLGQWANKQLQDLGIDRIGRLIAAIKGLRGQLRILLPLHVLRLLQCRPAAAVRRQIDFRERDENLGPRPQILGF